MKATYYAVYYDSKRLGGRQRVVVAFSELPRTIRRIEDSSDMQYLYCLPEHNIN